jgi:hypothetical protein
LTPAKIQTPRRPDRAQAVSVVPGAEVEAVDLEAVEDAAAAVLQVAVAVEAGEARARVAATHHRS